MTCYPCQHGTSSGREQMLTEIDGVPCIWEAGEGPLQAGLVFGVGRADEQLSISGVTHAIEHLALHACPVASRLWTGSVNISNTALHH